MIGAGLGGLAGALFLARRGLPVTLLERDPAPPPDSVDGLPGWVRRGTPQAGQSHAFVARCRQLLAEEAPDVLAALLAAGAEEIPLSPTPPPTLEEPPVPDPELVVLASRRTVFEWVLRRAVHAEPGVTVRAGAAATGLLTQPGPAGVPSVVGLTLDDGSSLPASTVIDAAGRRSMVAGWLAEAGADVPEERVIPCGIAYCSQFFRLRPGAPRPALNRGYVAGSSFDRYSCLVFPADNGTFSVTFGILPEDRDMRCLHDEDGFLAAARAVPVVADWLDPDVAEPISGVATMRGLDNRFRPLVSSGRPAALGLLAVGDAACITNPAHTRGSTLALTSALAAARAVDAHTDAESRALAVDTELRRSCEPRFWDSVEQDATRLGRWRPDAEVTSVPRPPGPDRVTNAAANAAAQRDPVVWRAFTRSQQLLELPDAVLADPDIVARTRAALAGDWRPPALAGPSHDELVAIARAGTAAGHALDRTG
ncbi:MAG: FAD-dependent oxidoreductase [Actinomycetota bacterium]|nr:FAD-dependent oxidoreductase [Actinomycetota bacterium]